MTPQRTQAKEKQCCRTEHGQDDSDPDERANNQRRSHPQEEEGLEEEGVEEEDEEQEETTERQEQATKEVPEAEATKNPTDSTGIGARCGLSARAGTGGKGEGKEQAKGPQKKHQQEEENQHHCRRGKDNEQAARH